MRAVPSHAVVPKEAIESLEAELSGSDDLEQRIDRAFGDLDARQPALASYLSDEIDAITDETVQALGHFLGVAVHEAFSGAFGKRLGRVDEASVAIACGTLEADEELRRGSPGEMLESDDVVAISQPHVLAYVREQLDAVLEPDDDGDASDVDLEGVHRVYRAVLIEIIALSHAVEFPAGQARRRAN